VSTLDLTSKSSTWLVTISWAGTIYRYTNQSQQVGKYISVPNMALRTAQVLGTLDPEVWEIELPFDNLAASLMSPGIKSKARVVLLEQLTDSRLQFASSSVKHSGVIWKAIHSPKGKRDWMLYSVSNAKQQLDMKPGFSLTETCANTLYKRGCLVNPSLHTFPATVEAFDPTTLTATLSGFPVPDFLTYFTAGHMELAGTLVGIRFWSLLAPSQFQTTQHIPESWIGKEVSLVAGCTRVESVCAGAFNNLKQFNPLGIAVPAYNPQFETGAGT